MDKFTPVCNFNIKLKGWEGPFQNLEHFLIVSERVKSLKNINGQHVLGSEGLLYKGKYGGLHNFEAELDLEAPDYVHIHYGPNGGILDVNRKGESFCLRGFGDIPRYTLRHLYKTLPNQKRNTKRSAIAGQIKSHSSYEIDKFLEDSLSREETKLKLLEQKYRTFVSNQ